VLASDLKVEIVLPFGLPDGRGRRARAAALTPINGRGEIMGAEDPNPFRAALHVLASSTARLGPFRTEDVDLGLLGSLLPVDRDFLLVQLNRLTFGDVRFQTVICPAAECGKRVDVELDLSTVTPPPVPAEASGRLSLSDGRDVRYRLPTSGDQVALHGLPADELEAAFVERCVRPEQADGTPSLGPDEVMSLPTELRAEIVREVVAASPELDMELDLECVECGKHFRFAYEPVHSLLRELRASRPALLKEVHYLAFYYHWSQTEILSLSRNLRREYLELLSEELNRQQAVLR
jgi:hypothetical protein